MCDNNLNDSFNELFIKVILNFDFYNSIENQKQRIEFALSNTYQSNINTIFKFIKYNT